MFNSFITSKAKKIRKAIKGERGYLLSLVYVDARKNKPILMPKSIFNILFDHCFLGKKSLLVNLIMLIIWLETALSIFYLINLWTK
jgi:hypothetical protein